MRKSFLLLVGLACLAGCQTPLRTPATLEKGPSVLSRGKLPVNNADPSVISVGNQYVSVEQRDGARIYVRTASTSLGLAGLGNDPGTLVYSAPSGTSELWAPEILTAGGLYYIYFTLRTDLNDVGSHRMFFLSSFHPARGYGMATELKLPDDRWAIDGVPFRFGGQWWFVWSGWEGTTNVEQNLYLCRMASPTTPTGGRFIVSQAREPWERADTGPAVNEGPEPIVDPSGRLHIVYSADGSWGPNYGLADLRLRAGGDPTFVWDWYKSNGQRFGSVSSLVMAGGTVATLARGVGHHSFVLPNGDVSLGPKAGTSAPLAYHGVPEGSAPSVFWFGRYWYAGSYSWTPSIFYTRGGTADLGYSLTFSE